MRIIGLTTCVGYADRLEKGLTLWRDGLNELVVVTSPEDSTTRMICGRDSVTTRTTAAFKRDGACFNKAAALNEGLFLLLHDNGYSEAISWLLLFDADVVPPEGWRDIAGHQILIRGHRPYYIYGASRVDEQGIRIPDGDQIGGYFQLFNLADPRWLAEPTFGSWMTASAYDSALMLRWPPENRVTLPLTLVHHGPVATHWLGPGTGVADVQALQARRQAEGPGSWKKERLR